MRAKEKFSDLAPGGQRAMVATAAMTSEISSAVIHEPTYIKRLKLSEANRGDAKRQIHLRRILCWRCKKFNHMPIGITEKDLRCAVGPRFPGREIRADFFQMALPRIESVDSQCEMVIFMAWEERRAEVGNQMQFLICAEAKPSTRK